MRRVIALVLVAAVALAIAGSYLVQPQQTIARGDCPPGDVQQTQQVIAEQTRAMTAQDFAAARQYATQAFRDNVTETRFADIIASDYPFLLQNPQITFTVCESYGPGLLLISANFRVGLGESEEHQLDYAMVNEAGRWFINSASNPKSRNLAA
jgi:hypothetical protein